MDNNDSYPIGLLLYKVICEKHLPQCWDQELKKWYLVVVTVLMLITKRRNIWQFTLFFWFLRYLSNFLFAGPLSFFFFRFYKIIHYWFQVSFWTPTLAFIDHLLRISFSKNMLKTVLLSFYTEHLLFSVYFIYFFWNWDSRVSEVSCNL